MSEDPRTKYLDAKNEHDKAKQDVTEMVIIMENVAKAIRENPSREDIGGGKMIENEKGKIFGTTIKVLSALHIFNANTWPDAKQILNKLNILNDTYSDTGKLYKAIPHSLRKNLPPPDEILRL